MATDPVIEFDRLLTPISDDEPVGGDPREDGSPTSLYYQIKDARSSARAIERQAMLAGDDDLDPPDWSPVSSLAPEMLASICKDLEIAAYYVEALTRRFGFAGLRDGFTLLNGLIEQFGDEIYPLPDEDGVETRLAPLTGLNGEGGEGTLIAPIVRIPLTDHSSVGQMTQIEFQTAQEIERLSGDARQRRIDQGGTEMIMFMTAVGETSTEFYTTLHEDIVACQEAYETYTNNLDEKYGYDAPPSTNIKDALKQCRETIEQVARDKLGAVLNPEPEQDDETAEAEADDASQKPKPDNPWEIRTREDAFNQLTKIAEFFRRTEPHTPVSYALDRLVRWGRLPLPELLQEIISDQSTVEQLFRLVGIERDQI